MPKKIMCVGEILWDALPNGLFLGGAPFNVACHLKMLGEESVICSRVGKDILGRQAIKRTDQKKLKTNFIQLDENHATGIVEVDLDKDGNASYTIVEPAAWDFIEISDLIIEEANKSDILVFGTLAQRNSVSRGTIKRLCALNKINIYDVNLRPPYVDRNIIKESLLAADVVKMNDLELTQISEWFDLSKDYQLAMKELSVQFNCGTVCITKGANGSVILHNDNITEHYGFKIKPKDTVGAGDAFLAALILGIVNRRENEEILKFANAIGGYVASKTGATPDLDFNKIEEIISGNIS